MNKIKHVRQLHPSGCIIACLAMVTKQTYQDVEKDFSPLDVRGLSTREMTDYLDKKNIKYTMLKYPDLGWGGVYLAVVPSVNSPRCNHQIVIDYNENQMVVLDPNKGNRGKKYYTAKNLITYTELIFIDDLSVDEFWMEKH